MAFDTCPSWTSWFNVSTRKLRRAMRLPEGDLPVSTSKSDQHQVVADVQPVNLDERQVHGPAASQSSACAAVQVGSVTSWPSNCAPAGDARLVDNLIDRRFDPRQAWELDDADKVERLLRNLVRRLNQEAPGVAVSILKGLDEMLTINRLGLPPKLRRSLACINSIENIMRTVHRVCRNVKRWRNAAMALRWTAAGMMDAAKGFRRLKDYKCISRNSIGQLVPG
jgi:hypothetical protein